MSTETISQFIERSLFEMAALPEYRIPASIIPDIAYLVEHHANFDSNSSKEALTEGLTRIIENLRKQGALG